jgi:hypothetical protein
LAVPEHPANNIQLLTKIVKETEEEVTKNPDKTHIRGVHQFNNYFCSLMGLGVPRRTYQDSEYQRFFAKAANIMMMYRLCDVMTWVLCPDDHGIVPLHERRAFKAPQNTVSIQFLHKCDIVTDVVYSSHSFTFKVSHS